MAICAGEYRVENSNKCLFTRRIAPINYAPKQRMPLLWRDVIIVNLRSTLGVFAFIFGSFACNNSFRSTNIATTTTMPPPTNVGERNKSVCNSNMILSNSNECPNVSE